MIMCDFVSVTVPSCMNRNHWGWLDQGMGHPLQ